MSWLVRAKPRTVASNYLKQSLRLAHGRFDVQAADVLPVLLQQRDKEVDGHHDVGNKFVFGHLDVSDGNSKAENLLQLELDGSTDFINLLVQVVDMGDGIWGLAGLVEARTKETGNLLDERIGGKESIVALGEFLDELLVLVELLQVISRHSINTTVLGTIDIMLVTENAITYQPRLFLFFRIGY